MSKKIWVYAEQSTGRLASVTFELLTKAQALASQLGDDTEIGAVLLGSQVESFIPELMEYGAAKIYLGDDTRLKLYSHVAYAPLTAEIVKAHQPDIVLFGATAIGSELAPTVAAILRTGVAAHSVDLRINEDGLLVAVVPAFGGKVLGDILCPIARPQMASIKPGIFVKGDPIPVQGEVISVDLSLLDSLKSTLKPLQLCREESKGLPLEEATVVVCGGFGIGCKENWQQLEELGSLLGGAVACTRPAIDEGWAAGEHLMVGTSGRSIRPKVYLGFGISGAAHHLCGMKDAGLIINVNNDENAAAFDISDVRAVADLNTVLPMLIEEVKKRRGL